MLLTTCCEQIPGFPTLILFPAGEGAEPIIFDEARIKEEIIDFVKDNAQVSHVVFRLCACNALGRRCKALENRIANKVMSNILEFFNLLSCRSLLKHA